MAFVAKSEDSRSQVDVKRDHGGLEDAVESPVRSEAEDQSQVPVMPMSTCVYLVQSPPYLSNVGNRSYWEGLVT